MNFSHRNINFALATSADWDPIDVFAGECEMDTHSARVLIADHLAVDIERVRDDAHFAEDLGADSLDMIELAMRFEQDLDIAIGDDESEACKTVRDAFILLDSKTVGRKAA